MLFTDWCRFPQLIGRINGLAVFYALPEVAMEQRDDFVWRPDVVIYEFSRGLHAITYRSYYLTTCLEAAPRLQPTGYN